MALQTESEKLKGVLTITPFSADSYGVYLKSGLY